MTWDPNKFTLDPTLCGGGILLSGITLENNRAIIFLIVYGPCNDRLLFWDRLASTGLLAAKNLFKFLFKLVLVFLLFHES